MSKGALFYLFVYLVLLSLATPPGLMCVLCYKVKS